MFSGSRGAGTPSLGATSGDKSFLDDVFGFVSQLASVNSIDELKPIEMAGLIACLVAVLVAVLVVLRCVVRSALRCYENYAGVGSDDEQALGKARRPSGGAHNGRLSGSRNGHSSVPGAERNLEV